MTRINRITRILDVLKPQYLEIIDETPKHAGHLNDDNLLETHLILKMSSPQLEGIPLIKQHKIINDLLKNEFYQGLHALSIKIQKISI